MSSPPNCEKRKVAKEILTCCFNRYVVIQINVLKIDLKPTAASILTLAQIKSKNSRGSGDIWKVDVSAIFLRDFRFSDE